MQLSITLCHEMAFTDERWPSLSQLPLKSRVNVLFIENNEHHEVRNVNWSIKMSPYSRVWNSPPSLDTINLVELHEILAYLWSACTFLLSLVMPHAVECFVTRVYGTEDRLKVARVESQQTLNEFLPPGAMLKLKVKFSVLCNIKLFIAFYGKIKHF